MKIPHHQKYFGHNIKIKLKCLKGYLCTNGNFLSNFDEVSCHRNVLLMIFDQLTKNEIFLIQCILSFLTL